MPAPVRVVLALPTALGWTVSGLGAASLVAGLTLGWRELLIAGVAALLLVALAGYYTIGRTQLAIDIDVVPPRVTVGDQFRGTVSIRNAAPGGSRRCAWSCLSGPARPCWSRSRSRCPRSAPAPSTGCSSPSRPPGAVCSPQARPPRCAATRSACCAAR
ncbi:hypothetical protein ACFQX7_26460 [Luedemannella flava]